MISIKIMAYDHESALYHDSFQNQILSYDMYIRQGTFELNFLLLLMIIIIEMCFMSIFCSACMNICTVCEHMN